MKPRKIPKFKGFCSRSEEHFVAAGENRILRLGIQLDTPRCNWNCPYCYAEPENSRDDNVPVEQIKEWISEGKRLGVTAVTVNGTFEPTTSKDLWKVLEHCQDLYLNTLLVTNGILLNEQRIWRLMDLETCVLMKLNVPISDKSEAQYGEYRAIQAFMSGKEPQTYDVIMDRLMRLVEAGFARPMIEEGVEKTRLGVESVITKQNIAHLPRLVRQLREKNIYAHIEVLKEQGGCQPGMQTTRAELERLFNRILEEDLREGYEGWVPKPPYIAGTCYQNLVRLNIKADGKVTPCPGIELILGDLKRGDTLKGILEGSEELRIIRNLKDLVEGDCKECAYLADGSCYAGCRGTAFQEMKRQGHGLKRRMVASDPSCWRVSRAID
ncbi:radical SAM protein [Candidatus Woesearchaeota archaeon]|nr:radical SAM protein [Candidatus Woesearchaeota archaeon]